MKYTFPEGRAAEAVELKSLSCHKTPERGGVREFEGLTCRIADGRGCLLGDRRSHELRQDCFLRSGGGRPISESSAHFKCDLAVKGKRDLEVGLSRPRCHNCTSTLNTAQRCTHRDYSEFTESRLHLVEYQTICQK